MISFLETILKVLTEFVTYIAAGVVTVVNLFFDGVGAVMTVAMEALPELPLPGEKIGGGLLSEINWFFPFGGIISVLTSMLVVYGLWLVVRYFLRLVRAA